MPARRQHRRGDGLTRKEREAVRRAQAQERIDVDAGTGMTEEEIGRAWREHQEWERHRRYAPPPVRAPRVALDIRAEMRQAFDAVMKDFSRWAGERAAREDMEQMN